MWDTFFHQYHLPPSDLALTSGVILDLGANVGYTAVHFAHRYPRSRVIAVEMDASNAALATANTASLSNVTVVNAAVWREDGAVAYDSNGSEWGFHVESGESANSGVLRSVRAISVASLLHECGVDSVDFLKMDIEGAEVEVIGDGGGWCEKVKCMKVEMHPAFNKLATFDHLSAQLVALGFRCEPDLRHPNTLIAVRIE